MQAAVFEGEGRLVVRDVEPPELGAPDDVLLAVRAAGICGTDVHILAVPPGHPATPGVIMGHEYAAEVAGFRAAQARACGADLIINPRQEDLAAVVRGETRLGADIVVDAVGSLLEDGLRCVRKGGRVLLFGMHEHARPTVKQYDVTKHELQILGTYIARGTFPQAVRLLAAGRLDFGRLVTHRVPLRDIQRGIDLLRRGEAVKVAVFPEA